MFKTQNRLWFLQLGSSRRNESLTLWPASLCCSLCIREHLSTWLPITRPIRATIYLSICERVRLRAAIRRRGCLRAWHQLIYAGPLFFPFRGDDLWENPKRLALILRVCVRLFACERCEAGSSIKRQVTGSRGSYFCNAALLCLSPLTDNSHVWTLNLAFPIS